MLVTAAHFREAIEALRQGVLQAAVESVGELEGDERIKALITFFHDNGYIVYCRLFSSPDKLIPYPSEYAANEQLTPSEQQAKFAYWLEKGQMIWVEFPDDTTRLIAHTHQNEPLHPEL